MPRCSGITKAGTRCTRRWRTADPGLSRGVWYCEQHLDQANRPEMNYGFEACWQADDEGRHCRKRKGHDGEHNHV